MELVLSEPEKFIAELQSLFCILFLEVLQKLHFVRKQSSLFLAHCEHTKDSLLFGMTNANRVFGNSVLPAVLSLLVVAYCSNPTLPSTCNLSTYQMNVFLVGASLLNAPCASTMEPVFKQNSVIFFLCSNDHNSVDVFSNDLKQK